MLSQLTQIQEDLLTLKQELIEEQLSLSPEQEDKFLSSISYPVERLPF